MPPVWTDLATAAALVHGSQGDDQGNLLIPRASDWHLAVTASRKVIATVEERVAGVLQDRPEWRLIPAIYLTALVHCPGGAAPTGYPGYLLPPGRSAPGPIPGKLLRGGLLHPVP
jgi:hypothetical protein